MKKYMILTTLLLLTMTVTEKMYAPPIKTPVPTSAQNLPMTNEKMKLLELELNTAIETILKKLLVDRNPNVREAARHIKTAKEHNVRGLLGAARLLSKPEVQQDPKQLMTVLSLTRIAAEPNHVAAQAAAYTCLLQSPKDRAQNVKKIQSLIRSPHHSAAHKEELLRLKDQIVGQVIRERAALPLAQ